MPEAYLYCLSILEIFILCFVLSVQDIRSRQISVPVLIVGYFIQILLIALTGIQNLVPHLVNSAIVFLFYFCQKLILTHKLGFGDLLFSAFCGLCIESWTDLWLCVIIPPFLALLFALIRYLVFKSWKWQEMEFTSLKIPYIPFMSAGLFITLLFERLIL